MKILAQSCIPLGLMPEYRATYKTSEQNFYPVKFSRSLNRARSFLATRAGVDIKQLVLWSLGK